MARCLIVSFLLACAGSAAAAPFADPTRPPSASGAGGADEAPSGPRLESVLLSPGRRLAVIDGREYRAGDAFGDGRILNIAPTGVAIQRGAQTERHAGQRGAEAVVEVASQPASLLLAGRHDGDARPAQVNQDVRFELAIC